MSNIPIFLSSSNDYSPFVATTIASICDNTKSFCDFYVLDGGISEENKEKISELKNQFNNFTLEFVKIDSARSFKDFPDGGHLTLETYNRLLIPQLKPNLGKILYFDIDIVVLGDIYELYSIDLGQYALGAAWDESRASYNLDTKYLMELSDDYKYFNAGVLLIDIPKWNKDSIVKQLFEIEKEYKNKVLHADESLLNKYFDNKYKVFDIKYNYIDYDVIHLPHKEPVVRHFASPLKPWYANYFMYKNNVYELKNFDDFAKYARMTVFYDEIKTRFMKNKNLNLLNKKLCAKIGKEL